MSKQLSRSPIIHGDTNTRKVNKQLSLKHTFFRERENVIDWFSDKFSDEERFRDLYNRCLSTFWAKNMPEIGVINHKIRSHQAHVMDIISQYNRNYLQHLAVWTNLHARYRANTQYANLLDTIVPQRRGRFQENGYINVVSLSSQVKRSVLCV